MATDAADAPVGFAAGAECDGQLYIAELDVHPDHAGRRLGARLLDAAAELARSRGLAGLLLTTFRHLPWNAPYYARLGFAILPDDAIGPELRQDLMRQQAAGLDMPNRVAMRRSL